MQKFLKPGAMLSKVLGRTFSTPKACFLDKHRGFFGHEKDSGSVQRSIIGHVRVYAFQLQDDRYDSGGWKELMG